MEQFSIIVNDKVECDEFITNLAISINKSSVKEFGRK